SRTGVRLIPSSRASSSSLSRCPGSRRPSTIASRISSVAATLALRTSVLPSSRILATAQQHTVCNPSRQRPSPPGRVAAPGYRRRVDRLAIARAERRRQVTEELEFERDRAGALRDELHRIVAELEGAAVDEQVFGQMSPEDVQLIGNAIQGGPAVDREGLEEEWLDEEEPIPDDGLGSDEELWAELREEQEAEIVRIQEE